MSEGGTAAEYAVEGVLAKLRVNHGIESMAVSKDFRFLYYIVQ